MVRRPVKPVPTPKSTRPGARAFRVAKAFAVTGAIRFEGIRTPVARRILLVRMAAAGELFDVLFLDPPYAAGLLQDALETASPLCAPRGVIVAEHESRDADSLSAHIGHSLHRADQREYGRTSVTIYRRRNPEEET